MPHLVSRARLFRQKEERAGPLAIATQGHIQCTVRRESFTSHLAPTLSPPPSQPPSAVPQPHGCRGRDVVAPASPGTRSEHRADSLGMRTLRKRARPWLALTKRQKTLSNKAPVHPVPASWLHFGEMRHAGRGELSCFLPSRRDPRTLQSEGYRTDPIIHITHRHRHFRLACQCTLGASRIFAEMPVRREC